MKVFTSTRTIVIDHRAMLQDRHGFSLIELMLVVALISVLAGIAVPPIAGALRQYGVVTATREVAAAIRSARVQAVGKNKQLHVHFEPEARSYQLMDTADQPAGSLLYLPTGTGFVDADTDVEFSTSGRLQNPGLAPITIVVGNGDADQNRTITVTSSGRVQLP
jgi:prepilin-type N-terminal cleavage/methylation domain-containing protein